MDKPMTYPMYLNFLSFYLMCFLFHYVLPKSRVLEPLPTVPFLSNRIEVNLGHDHSGILGTLGTLDSRAPPQGFLPTIDTPKGGLVRGNWWGGTRMRNNSSPRSPTRQDRQAFPGAAELETPRLPHFRGVPFLQTAPYFPLSFFSFFFFSTSPPPFQLLPYSLPFPSIYISNRYFL